jgi:hypothetical protein
VKDGAKEVIGFAIEIALLDIDPSSRKLNRNIRAIASANSIAGRRGGIPLV